MVWWFWDGFKGRIEILCALFWGLTVFFWKFGGFLRRLVCVTCMIQTTDGNKEEQKTFLGGQTFRFKSHLPGRTLLVPNKRKLQLFGFLKLRV